MKVKQEILDSVNTPQKRTLIALDLGIGEQTVAIQMRRNASNGRMTKMDFLQAISKVSGVAVDEILETELVKSPQS
jgi:hypothetical protein